MSVNILKSIASLYGQFEAIFNGNKAPELFKVFKDIVGSYTDSTKACVCLRLFNLCSADAPEALLLFNNFLPAEYAFIEKSTGPDTKPRVILPKTLEEHSRTCPNDHSATNHPDSCDDENMLMHTIETLLPTDSSLEFKYLIIAFSSQQIEAIEFVMYSTYLMKEYPELLTCLMFYLTSSWKNFSYKSFNIVPLEQMGINYGLSQNLPDDEYMCAILRVVSDFNLLSQSALEWRASVIQSINKSLNEMMGKSPKLFDHTRTTVLNLMNDGRTKDVYQPLGPPTHIYEHQGDGYVITNGTSDCSLPLASGKTSVKDKYIKPYRTKPGSNARISEHWSSGRNTIGIMRSILTYEGPFGAEFKNLGELAQHTENYFSALLCAKELPRHAILSYRIPCCRVFLVDVCETLLNSNALPLMKDSYASAKMHKYGFVDSFKDYGVSASNSDVEKCDEADRGKANLSQFLKLNLDYFHRRQEYLKKVQSFMKRYVSLPPADQYLLITRKHNEAITFIENIFFCQLKYNLQGIFALASLNEFGDSRPLSCAWQQVAASYIKANSHMNYPCRITVDDSFLVYMQLIHSKHIQDIIESYPSISHKACRGLFAQRINKEVFDQYAPYITRWILSKRDVYENFLFFSNDKNFDTISQLPQSWNNAINHILFYLVSGNYTAQNIHEHNMLSIQQTAQIAESISTGAVPSYSQWITQTGDMLLPLDIPVMSIATENNLTTFEMRINRLSMEERNKISAANVPECNTSYRFRHPIRTVRHDSVLNKYYYGTFPMGSESSAKSIRQMNVSQLMEDNRKIVQSTDDIAGLEEELIKYDVVIYNLKLIEQKLQVFCSKHCPNLLHVECSRNDDSANDVLYEHDCQIDDVTFETVKKRESTVPDSPTNKEINGASHIMESSYSDPCIIATTQELDETARELNEPEIKRLAALSPTNMTHSTDPGASLLLKPSDDENSDPIHGGPIIPITAPKLLIKDEISCQPQLQPVHVSIKKEEARTQDSGQRGDADEYTTSRNTIPDSPIAANVTARFLQNPRETSIYPLTPRNASNSLRHKNKLSTTDIQREVIKDMELGQTACLDLPLPCLETIKSVIGPDYYDLFLRRPKTSAPFVLKRLRVFLRDLQNHRNVNQSPLIVKKLRTCSLRNLDHLSNGQAEADKRTFSVRNLFTDFELKQKNSYHISDVLVDKGHYNTSTYEFVLKPEVRDPSDNDNTPFWDKFVSISNTSESGTKFWIDEEQCPEERFKEQRNVTQKQLMSILSNQAYPGCYCSCVEQLNDMHDVPINDIGLSLLNKLKCVVDAMYAQARQKQGFHANPAQHKCYFLPHVAFNIRHIKPETLQFLKMWLLNSHLDTPSSMSSTTVDDGLQEGFFNAIFGQILYADSDAELEESQSATIIEFMTYILIKFAHSVLTRLSIARQLCEEVRPGVSAETLQLEVLRKFGLVDPFDVASPQNAYEYSILFMNLLNAIPGSIATCAEINQMPTQSLCIYFTEKEIAEALESARCSFQPSSRQEVDNNKARNPRTDLYWLVVQWYILSEKVSQEQFEFDMTALLGSSIAVIFNLKTIMKNMRKIYNDVLSMYVEVHRIHVTDGTFKGNTVDANMISAVLLYIQNALKINMLAEQSGKLLSRNLLCEIANKRGSGIMLSEVVAGCMCFTELFDVKPTP